MDSKLYSKCKIIVEASDNMRESDDPLWQEFFRIHTIGVPAAKIIFYDFGTINERGMQYLEETWLALCKLVMVDSDEEYEFFDDMLEIGAISES